MGQRLLEKERAAVCSCRVRCELILLSESKLFLMSAHHTAPVETNYSPYAMVVASASIERLGTRMVS